MLGRERIVVRTRPAEPLYVVGYLQGAKGAIDHIGGHLQRLGGRPRGGRALVLGQSQAAGFLHRRQPADPVDRLAR